MFKVIMGVANLVVAASPMIAHAQAPAIQHKENVAKFNVASLKSIEGSWLKVAASCKARGFNASPVELSDTSISSAAAKIYSEFKV
tara:strand:+ start:18890 stop:19147 length:258 start_codon:yes stop_codon:yes gene_type:complete